MASKNKDEAGFMGLYTLLQYHATVSTHQTNIFIAGSGDTEGTHPPDSTTEHQTTEGLMTERLMTKRLMECD